MNTVEKADASHAPHCDTCGEPTHFEMVFVTMWLGGELIVIEDVPAYVCSRCNLQYYEPDVEQKIRQLVVAGFPPHRAYRSMPVPVFRIAPRPIAAIPSEDQQYS